LILLIALAVSSPQGALQSGFEADGESLSEQL